MERTNNQNRRRTLLLASVVANLGLLGFFKYYYFFTDNTSSLLSLFGVDWSAPNWNIILPVGISFYTFQSMSYTIDVYRAHSGAYKKFWAFAAYIALFPQLVAGPIVRHDELVPQILKAGEQRFNSVNFSRGIYFFVLGLSKKLLIADLIGVAVDQLLGQVHQLSLLEAWLCALGYTLQLYFDFSGYSDMAIGLGWFLGFSMPQNFNSPYKSKSITEFWQRWHMTLSFWLRDYLYISLGGNRRGQWKTYRNLFLTMFLGGLWHGAGWTFAIWGSFHGLLLAIERFSKNNLKDNILVSTFFSAPGFIKQACTFLLVVIGWVLFRAPTMDIAWVWYTKMFTNPNLFTITNLTSSAKDRFLGALVIGLILVFFTKNSFEKETDLKYNYKHALWYAFLFFMCVIYLAKESPFLYFQF